MDLFKDYDPGPVVERFAEQDVKAFTPAARLSKSIARVLADSKLSRDDIAQRMSEVTHERITRVMLDNYASQTKEHAISAQRLAALSIVTGDVRALNELLRDAGLIVVDQSYEALLRRERAKELADRFERDAAAADAEWRAKR